MVPDNVSHACLAAANRNEQAVWQSVGALDLVDKWPLRLCVLAVALQRILRRQWHYLPFDQFHRTEKASKESHNVARRLLVWTASSGSGS